jgi:hypothetical protein
MTPKEVAEQLGGRFGPQWKQWQLIIVRPLHPSSVVFRAEVEQQQTAVSGCGIDYVLEECLARAIEPVKVLEEEDGRLPGAPSARESADDVEELALPRLRLRWWHGLLGIGHPKEIEHHRQPFAEILVEAHHAPGDLVASGGSSSVIPK